MKKLMMLALALLLVGVAAGKGRKLVIRGEIAGLEIGDTLRFERIELPKWTLSRAFDDQPLLREATQLDYSISRERSRHLRSMREAFAAGDSIKGREYLKQFNEFRAEDDEKRVAELEKKFFYANPSSPWSLVNTLQRSSNAPVDTLEAYYGRLDRRARTGYFGTLLREQIERRKALLPGQPAPDFTAALPDGRTKNAQDFRGKYLLIYHWGFCPGSIQREMDAVELYRRHKDRLEILGVTERLSVYAEVAAGTPEHETMFGIKLRPVYESMAAHPWIDVEAGANPQINELYDFAGFPFFILISPDGKIVSRGFHETFFEAKGILEKL